MARTVHPDAPGEDTSNALSRSFQSGYINFLIGSGASIPAIPPAGAIEKTIAELLLAGNESAAKSQMYDFLATIREPMNALILGSNNENNTTTLTHYKDFLGIVERLLAERRTTLIPKQATIFTTNYDLFTEKASASYPSLRLNDGFNRAPTLAEPALFSSRVFFNSVYNTGNLYSYEVEIPSINLVKLHGSFSWRKTNNDIAFDVVAVPLLAGDKTALQLQEFIDKHAVVLPQASKFRTTVLDRTYYELLRIYANELDRENALLVTFGFSFDDEHILDITKRALKNPTLRLVIFAYDDAARISYSSKFDGYNNVILVAPAAGAQLNFPKFNEVIRSLLPK